MCAEQTKCGARTCFLVVVIFSLVGSAGLIGCSEGSVCGDGVVESGEMCDDGNTANSDGCSAECTQEAGWSCNDTGCTTICGDGYVRGLEVCDPGDSPYCSSDCSSLTGSCGDGILQVSIEDCDPGAGVLRGCSAACTELFGFTCTDQPMECTASTLPGDRTMSSLTLGEFVTYCQWFADTMGGVGASFQCGDYIFTILSAQECADNMINIAWGTCTVGDTEDWISQLGSECAVMTGADPPCM